MPAAAIGCNKSMSPMTQARAWCDGALARLVADACCDAFGCVSAPTVARRRETSFQIDGVCLTKRLSRRRATDAALTGQPRQVAAGWPRQDDMHFAQALADRGSELLVHRWQLGALHDSF